MRINSVTILGLGQIGGSLALALKKQNPGLFIHGVEISKKRRDLISPQIDKVSQRLDSSPGSDVVFVCLHFEKTLAYLSTVDPSLLVVDVCSTKSEIMKLALRRKLRMIGGHPIAGSELELEKGWNADLFAGAKFLFCPSRYALHKDIEMVKRLARSIGATPKMVEATEHDRMMAITSHLPAVLSKIYFEMSEDVPEYYRGPGFRSFTRLAHSPTELLQTFLDSNLQNIRQAGRAYTRAVESVLGRK
jgi:prephenate dehydrogenase